MDDIKAGVQYIFQTQNSMTFALSATGHAAMECVMTNMLEPGKTVLIANNGIWGIRSADMARRQGATVKEIVTAAGTNFSLAQLTAGVKEHKPDLLFVTHGESSTGVVQPLEGVGAMCHQHNCLLAVDTVASLGGVPVMADQMEIDVIYTGSQKVLGVPPGTAPISFSARAVQAFKSRSKPPCSFYLGECHAEYLQCNINVISRPRLAGRVLELLARQGPRVSPHRTRQRHVRPEGGAGRRQ